LRWKSPRPLVFCSPRGQVRIPSGTYRCRAHSARLAARALGELEPSWTASRRRSPSRRSREDSASVAYERGGPGSSAPKAVSSPGRYTDRVERAISRATVFPFVWAILGTCFFIPMAMWVGGPQYPRPADWVAVTVVLILGFGAGIGLRLRNRVAGLPGTALRILLFTAIIFAAAFGVAVIRLGIENRHRCSNCVWVQ